MEKDETIQTAPEIMSVSDAFTKFRSMPGNETKTLNEFYSLLTTPSIDRSILLTEADFVMTTSENIIRPQYVL